MHGVYLHNWNERCTARNTAQPRGIPIVVFAFTCASNAICYYFPLYCSTCMRTFRYATSSSPNGPSVIVFPLLARRLHTGPLKIGSCSHDLIPTGIVRNSLRGNTSRRIRRIFLLFAEIRKCMNYGFRTYFSG